MAKEIRWSLRSLKERQKIGDYWIKRNKSNTYSLKLDQLFRQGVNLLVEAPAIGKPTDFPTVRFIIVRDYLVYYRISDDYVEVITIWDPRRNPKKFKL